MAKTNLTDLLSQKAELEIQIAEMQRNERAEAIAQVRALMMQFGLSVADIASKAGGPKISGPKAGAKWRPSTATQLLATPGAGVA